MHLTLAKLRAFGVRNALGPGVRAGWDIGGASLFALDAYLAPVVAWTRGAATGASPGLGYVAGATLGVPWLSLPFIVLLFKGEDPAMLLAIPLALLPDSVGLRLENLPGDGHTRVGVIIGWSFFAPMR